MEELLEKQKKVKEILLTEIICEKRRDKIYKLNQKIYSGQNYYSHLDSDMSDISIKFYEVLYRNSLLKGEKNILNGRYFSNNSFAGDTINSFNIIANRVDEAGKNNKNRTSIDCWPKYLQDYCKKYHCLANFWIVPIKIGRKSKKLNAYDSVDIFLNYVCENFSLLKSEYKDYFDNVKDYGDYLDIHFIYNKLIDSKEVLNLYADRKMEKIVKIANEFIENRAKIISESSLCTDLYELFEKYNLI